MPKRWKAWRRKSGFGRKAAIHAADLTADAEPAGLIEALARDFGRLDILVNNAGTTHVNKPMLDITEDEYERMFAVNVKGVFFGCQAVVPVFRKQGGGVIINIGSTAGLRPRPGLSAYNATKGAVHTLTKSLAVELGGDHIRVCAIAPVATACGKNSSPPCRSAGSLRFRTWPTRRCSWPPTTPDSSPATSSRLTAAVVSKALQLSHGRIGRLPNGRIDAESATIAGLLASAPLHGSFLSPQALVYPCHRGRH
jgi:NAD(P)-dependent dehydrogenase (short-subunit alcohol dehydrogenase family)